MVAKKPVKKESKKPIKKESKETKHDLFLRLAKSRTTKVLKAIRILKNCSNRNYYEYTQIEVEQIFQTIQDSLDACKTKFADKKEQEKFEFL